jgi:predicted nuclease of restriction endonuclease-like RecB superfamily
MEEKIINTLKDLKVLLIIDNLDDALRSDRDVVLGFIRNLLDKLSDLKILSTSRDQIGNNLGEIKDNVYELKHLTKDHTIQLLKKILGR